MYTELMQHFLDRLKKDATTSNKDFVVNAINTLLTEKPDDITKMVQNLALEHAKNANDVHISTLFAFCLQFGFGIEKDTKRALEIIQTAVAQNFYVAMVGLADILLEEESDENNKTKAFALYKQAADAGDTDGRLELGHAYLFAVGTPKNIPLGLELYIALSNANCAEAQYRLACIYLEGSIVAKDETNGLKQMELAAKNGYALASEYLKQCKELEEKANAKLAAADVSASASASAISTVTATVTTIASTASTSSSVQPLTFSSKTSQPFNRPPKRRSVLSNQPLPTDVNANTDLGAFIAAKVLPPSPWSWSLARRTDGSTASVPVRSFNDGGCQVKTEAEVIAVINRNWPGYLANITKSTLTSQWLNPSIKTITDQCSLAKENFVNTNSKYLNSRTGTKNTAAVKSASTTRPLGPRPKNGPMPWNRPQRTKK